MSNSLCTMGDTATRNVFLAYVDMPIHVHSCAIRHEFLRYAESDTAIRRNDATRYSIWRREATQFNGNKGYFSFLRSLFIRVSRPHVILASYR